MSTSSRLAALAAAAALGASALVGVAATPAGAAAGASQPGLSGTAIPLGSSLVLSEGQADMAFDNHGTAYAAWIATSAAYPNRTVFLCVLPPSAPSCKGGIQHIDSLGDASAEDIHVLMVKGVPTLLWMHDTITSGSGPENSEIATATVSSAGVLSAAADVQPAPSYGELLDAEVAPNGEVWTLTYSGVPVTTMELRVGLSTTTPISVKVPYGVGFAHLAWDHGTPIIAITKDGAISTGPAYSAGTATGFPKFKTLPHTWAVGHDIVLVNAGGHVRLITAVGNADYSPVEATWTGHAFSAPKPTGYPKGYPTSLDGDTDSSGRLVDISNNASTEITVGNLSDDKHAANFQFAFGGSFAGISPQVATTARGRGWAMWSVQDGSTGDRLRVAPFRLAGRHQSVRKAGPHGAVSIIGPASCLPASSISLALHGSAKSGWKVSKKTLKLGSKKVGSTLNGATLTPGKSYTLIGTVVFADKSSGKHSTVTAKLKFTSCHN